MTTTPLNLALLDGVYAVCQLPPDAPIPPFPTEGPVRSITATAREISIVCLESDTPEGSEIDGGWRAIAILGPIPFDQAGVLVSVLAPISAQGLGVFALSTFDGDVVLVREATLDLALGALHDAGFVIER